MAGPLVSTATATGEFLPEFFAPYIAEASAAASAIAVPAAVGAAAAVPAAAGAYALYQTTSKPMEALNNIMGVTDFNKRYQSFPQFKQMVDDAKAKGVDLRQFSQRRDDMRAQGLQFMEANPFSPGVSPVATGQLGQYVQELNTGLAKLPPETRQAFLGDSIYNDPHSAFAPGAHAAAPAPVLEKGDNAVLMAGGGGPGGGGPGGGGPGGGGPGGGGSGLGPPPLLVAIGTGAVKIVRGFFNGAIPGAKYASKMPLVGRVFIDRSAAMSTGGKIALETGFEYGRAVKWFGALDIGDRLAHGALNTEFAKKEFPGALPTYETIRNRAISIPQHIYHEGQGHIDQIPIAGPYLINPAADLAVSGGNDMEKYVVDHGENLVTTGKWKGRPPTFDIPPPSGDTATGTQPQAAPKFDIPPPSSGTPNPVAPRIHLNRPGQQSDASDAMPGNTTGQRRHDRLAMAPPLAETPHQKQAIAPVIRSPLTIPGNGLA